MRIKTFALAAALATGLVVTGVAAPAWAGGYFNTNDNVNLRECPVVSQCGVLTVIPRGTTLFLNCWYPGTSVNGDTVWYDTTYGGYDGMVSGWYVNTGHDPNPAVSRCG